MTAEAHDRLPALYAIAPFVALLAAIAVFPLMSPVQHWWESNINRLYVAIALAGVTLGYYVLLGGTDKVVSVLDHAVLREFVPFIVLLFALYTISGGIRIEGDLIATPMTNALFLAAGGLLASFIGTTGAAMLLIRPLLETNEERKNVQHTVVFFIFIVCNCGGCLLPIGDPPLFLGYLMGVPFMWTMWNLFIPWLLVNAILILVYFLMDRYYYLPRETAVDLSRDRIKTRPLRVSGLQPNLWLLIGVVLCVALLDPNKPVPYVNWYPWPFLREVLQLLLVALSLGLGLDTIRAANRFNYHAIVEVAALFIGIFICMQPAIEILHAHGASLGLDSPKKLFWATGSLSALLDNAPTYVVFYETAAAGFAGQAFHQLVSSTGSADAPLARQLLIGISLGAVFMGAMTYIGNGPNFMVRAIAEQSGVRMPSFFGYVIRYAATHPDSHLPGCDLDRLAVEWSSRNALHRLARRPLPSHERVDYQYINSPAELSQLCEAIASSAWIGFDTEFVSEHTYFPDLCLIQVVSEGQLALVDPRDGLDATLFWQTLADFPGRVIVHAGREEFLFCDRAVTRPTQQLVRYADRRRPGGSGIPRFLWQIDPAVAGRTRQEGRDAYGLAQRPLSKNQLHYAVLDVTYLPALHDKLMQLLEENSRLTWLADETQRWFDRVHQSETKERWRRVAGTASLPYPAQLIVRELWRWRDEEARRRDCPPRRVLRDDLINELARSGTSDVNRIRAIRGMGRHRFARSSRRDRQAHHAGQKPGSEHAAQAEIVSVSQSGRHPGTVPLHRIIQHLSGQFGGHIAGRHLARHS